MADDLKPLQPHDEVYIKPLGAYGRVVRVRPGDIREPEEQRLYEVQAASIYFRRTDLEIGTTKDDIEKRKKIRAEKAARAEAAQQNFMREHEAGGVKPTTVVECAVATDDYLKELGFKGFLQPIKSDPTK